MAYEIYFCDLIEKDRMLRKTLNFDEIDYEEYDKIYEDISKFYDDLIKNKVLVNSENKLKNIVIVLSHNAKRLHKLIEKMLKIIERNESNSKEMDYYTFIDTEKFINCFNNIGGDVNFYKDNSFI